MFCSRARQFVSKNYNRWLSITPTYKTFKPEARGHKNIVETLRGQRVVAVISSACVARGHLCIRRETTGAVSFQSVLDLWARPVGQKRLTRQTEWIDS